MSLSTPLPAPVGPHREGITVIPAPYVVNGWRRICSSCGASVKADHIPASETCRSILQSKHDARVSDLW